MNCDALRPAVTKTVVFLSNLPASRNRLLFKPPHKPRSELTTMTARFFTSRISISGCLNDAMRGPASARIAFIKSAYGRPTSAACCALRILAAATICIALVIWAVFFTDLMRRRMSRVLGMKKLAVARLEFRHGRFEFGGDRVA